MLTLKVGYDAVGSGTVYQVPLDGGLGSPAHIVWGCRENFGRISVRVHSQIGDKPGLGISVVNGHGRLPRWASS